MGIGIHAATITMLKDEFSDVPESDIRRSVNRFLGLRRVLTNNDAVSVRSWDVTLATLLSHPESAGEEGELASAIAAWFGGSSDWLGYSQCETVGDLLCYLDSDINIEVVKRSIEIAAQLIETSPQGDERPGTMDEFVQMIAVDLGGDAETTLLVGWCFFQVVSVLTQRAVVTEDSITPDSRLCHDDDEGLAAGIAEKFKVECAPSAVADMATVWDIIVFLRSDVTDAMRSALISHLTEEGDAPSHAEPDVSTAAA